MAKGKQQNAARVLARCLPLGQNATGLISCSRTRYLIVSMQNDGHLLHEFKHHLNTPLELELCFKVFFFFASSSESWETLLSSVTFQ